jgi:hypothetical protein
MARRVLPLLAALAALTTARAQAPAASSAAGAAPPPAATPSGTSPRAGGGTALEEVSGTVREVDRKTHRLTVDTAGGRITMSLDRNTMVYTPAGLGTVLDVTPGSRIRAGRNADFLAYWVQVRAPAKAGEVPSAPAQGTGPGGGSGAAATESRGPPGGAPAGPGGTAPATPSGGATPAGR